MGRYSYGHDDEVTPALQLNGSKLLNTVHQVMIGNTRTISPTVLNEFRFGFNSFFNTFGRELAYTRDVVSELAIPGVSPGPPESWGIPTIGISGYNGFGDNTEGPYTNRNKVFEFVDNLSWIRGTHSFKLGGSIRFDQFNQDGNQFSRGSFSFDGRATGFAHGRGDAGGGRVRRFPARLSAHVGSGGRARDDAVPRDQPVVLLQRHLAACAGT